jgi:hypothetical protein
VNDAALLQTASPDFIFEWNVTHENETLSASLSLVNVITSQRILDRTLKFSQNKLAEMCNEAASSVAHALDVDASDMQASYMTTSVNKEAYDWYLFGRSMGFDGNSASLDSIAAVFDCARQSDPTYPYAESAFGWTNVLLHSALTDTASVYLEEAGKSLKRAVSLGGTSAEVYRLWGVIEFFRSDFHRAILRLENAAKISPPSVSCTIRRAGTQTPILPPSSVSTNMNERSTC